MSVLSKFKEKCCGCGACESICPANAIEMKTDADGFMYPAVDEAICTECKKCESVCPQSAEYSGLVEAGSRKAFAAINKDERRRMAGSSGGVFSALAEYIIENNGFVFGAAFNDNFRGVNHICVKSKPELDRLYTSKYIQSDFSPVFSEIKKLLETGEPVLCSGTPCQINALKLFLGCDYDNLFAVDIICHGVPSAKIWNMFLGTLKSSRIDSVNLRDKSAGWKEFCSLMKMETDLGEELYCKNHSDDLFMKAFLSNYSLRPSCFACKSKGKNRLSDITLGDFWGIENVLPEMDDNKGTSLVIINSEKGQRIWDDIAGKINAAEVSAEEALSFNSAAENSVKMPSDYSAFFADADKMKFQKLVNKYIPVPIKTRLKKYKIVQKALKIKHKITGADHV